MRRLLVLALLLWPAVAGAQAVPTLPVSATQSGTWTVTGSGGTFPVTDSGGSLTVDAPVGTPVFVRLSDGSSAITTLPVSLASVPSHAVTNAGTFATQAAQSGTWTVQPGNTANTTAWLVTGTGGTFPATQSGTWNITNISGTVSLPTGAATSANQSTEITSLQLIDNLPNTIGSTTSGQSLVLSGCAVTTSAPTYTNAQTHPCSMGTGGGIRVEVVGGGGGGTSAVDDADFTDSSSSFTPSGGVAESASPSSCTEGDFCTAATTLNRAWKVSLYAANGDPVVPSSDYQEDTASAGGEFGPLVLSVRRNAAAASTATDTEFATVNTDALGLLWTRQLSPCTGVATTTVPISVAADTAVISASSGNRNYICGGLLIAQAAEVMSIWEGTGTACGTSSAAIAGSTTEANGLSLAANGGFAVMQPIRGIGTNVDTCIRVVGSNRISGWLSVVQAP